MTEQPILLCEKEVVCLVGVSRTKWRSLLASGRAPAPIHLGRSIRWRRADIEAWIAAGCPPRAEWEAPQHQQPPPQTAQKWPSTKSIATGIRQGIVK